MNTTHDVPDTRLIAALAAADASVRLRAALRAGTQPDPRLAEVLVARCARESDFFVRDMLTWALCRLPAEDTVPRLIETLGSRTAQARSQALHTLSKIGDARAWPAVAALLHDEHDEVARTAWRTAVGLVPDGAEATLAADLAAALGRGDQETQRSMSRALIELGDAVLPVLEAAGTHPDPLIRAHARATQQLYDDPDSGFTPSLELARRVAATGSGPSEEVDDVDR